jgi:hypothetical protein
VDLIRIVASAALCLPAYAQNSAQDPATDLGVTWTDTLEMVKAKYPNGSLDRHGKSLVWKIRDSRPLFSVQRREQDFVQFEFNGSIIETVTISFPDCGDLAAALGATLTVPPNGGRGIMAPVKLGTWNGGSVMAVAIPTGDSCWMRMLLR